MDAGAVSLFLGAYSAHFPEIAPKHLGRRALDLLENWESLQSVLLDADFLF